MFEVFTIALQTPWESPSTLQKVQIIPRMARKKKVKITQKTERMRQEEKTREVKTQQGKSQKKL